jgi:hypothetical protein
MEAANHKKVEVFIATSSEAVARALYQLHGGRKSRLALCVEGDEFRNIVIKDRGRPRKNFSPGPAFIWEKTTRLNFLKDL